MPSFKKRFQDCAGRLTTRITVVFGLLLGILISLFISSIVQIQKETEQTVRDAIANTLNIYEADYEAQLDTAQLMMSEIYGQMDNLRNLGADDQRASYFARYELTTDMEGKGDRQQPDRLHRRLLRRRAAAAVLQPGKQCRTNPAVGLPAGENETFFTRYMSSSRENWRLAKIEEDYYLLRHLPHQRLHHPDPAAGRYNLRDPPLLRGQPGAVRPGLCRRGSGVPFARRGRQRAFPLYPDQ